MGLTILSPLDGEGVTNYGLLSKNQRVTIVYSDELVFYSKEVGISGTFDKFTREARTIPRALEGRGINKCCAFA